MRIFFRSTIYSFFGADFCYYFSMSQQGAVGWSRRLGHCWQNRALPLGKSKCSHSCCFALWQIPWQTSRDVSYFLTDVVSQLLWYMSSITITIIISGIFSRNFPWLFGKLSTQRCCVCYIQLDSYVYPIHIHTLRNLGVNCWEGNNQKFHFAKTWTRKCFLE